MLRFGILHFVQNDRLRSLRAQRSNLIDCHALRLAMTKYRFHTPPRSVGGDKFSPTNGGKGCLPCLQGTEKTFRIYGGEFIRIRKCGISFRVCIRGKRFPYRSRSPSEGQDELTSAFQREKKKRPCKNKIFSLWKAAITYPPGSNLQVLSA